MMGFNLMIADYFYVQIYLIFIMYYCSNSKLFDGIVLTFKTPEMVLIQSLMNVRSRYMIIIS